jgi:hypothetical protein
MIREFQLKCAGCRAPMVFVPPMNRGLLLTGKPDNITRLPPPGPHYCDHCARIYQPKQRAK